jgi:hypothetical protein
LKKVLTVLSHKDQKDFTIDELDKLMSNIGNVQFSYDLLKQAYDSDPAIKKLIKNFDQDKVTLATGDAVDDLPAADADTDQTVSKMAQRATDLG